MSFSASPAASLPSAHASFRRSSKSCRRRRRPAIFVPFSLPMRSGSSSAGSAQRRSLGFARSGANRMAPASPAANPSIRPIKKRMRTSFEEPLPPGTREAHEDDDEAPGAGVGAVGPHDRHHGMVRDESDRGAYAGARLADVFHGGLEVVLEDSSQARDRPDVEQAGDDGEDGTEYEEERSGDHEGHDQDVSPVLGGVYPADLHGRHLLLSVERVFTGQATAL